MQLLENQDRLRWHANSSYGLQKALSLILKWVIVIAIGVWAYHQKGPQIVKLFDDFAINAIGEKRGNETNRYGLPADRPLNYNVSTNEPLCVASLKKMREAHARFSPSLTHQQKDELLVFFENTSQAVALNCLKLSAR